MVEGQSSVEGVLYNDFEGDFAKNWDSRHDLWCTYTRHSAVALGNNTNNRLEASWKHQKEVVSSFMAVGDCIAAIIVYPTSIKHDYQTRLFNHAAVGDARYDNERARVAYLVSQHAFSLNFNEYEFATTATRYQYYEAFQIIYIIKSVAAAGNARDEPGAEYAVEKPTWTYSCLFMTTQRLPHGHVIYIRKCIGAESKIPTDYVDPHRLC